MNRQIDVSIRWRFDGEEQLTVVQVKDWNSKRADVNDVGTFSAVVQDVRANQGIMICRKGFSKAAVTYARNRGIQLHHLHDEQNTRWRSALRIPLVWEEWIVRFDFEITAFFDTSHVVSINSHRVVHESGDTTPILQIFAEQWNRGIIDKVEGGPYLFTPPGNVVMHINQKGGGVSVRSPKSFSCKYTAERHTYLGQFEPSECRGIVDLLQEDTFTASYLPLDQIPRVRDKSWTSISSAERLALKVRGTMVTLEQRSINYDEGASFSLQAEYLGPA